MRIPALSVISLTILSSLAQAGAPSIACNTVNEKDPNSYAIVYDITGTHYSLWSKAPNSHRPVSIPLVASYFGLGTIKLANAETHIRIVAKVAPKRIISADVFSDEGLVATCPEVNLTK